MKKIDWEKGFIGIDGHKYSQLDITNFFIDELGVEDHIKVRLNELKTYLSSQSNINAEIKKKKIVIQKIFINQFVKIIEKLIKKLNDIILSSPEKSLYFSTLADKYQEIFIKCHQQNPSDTLPELALTYFRKKLEKAFHYSHFRDNGLNQLAGMLNIKTCPYCNQNYTLVIGNDPNSVLPASLADSDAFLQFDHFIPKSKYPFLSMSLYNLIPSCPFCNLKKRDSHISLKYHPYVSDVSSKIKFRIKNPDMIINPFPHTSDILEIELDTSGDRTLTEFYEKIALPARYSRHLSEVQDINVGIYVSRYYNDQYNTLASQILPTTISNEEMKAAFERHIRGFYKETEDIDKRPLTKFSQDIHEQLSFLIRHRKDI